MNTAQKIQYAQMEYDKEEVAECAVTNLQLAVINDFETNGFVGNRFFPEDTLKDVIYDAISEQTAELLAAMVVAKKDPHKFRDSAFALLSHLEEIKDGKSYEIALKMYNEREEI